jgi:signal transduction histidine kinase
MSITLAIAALRLAIGQTREPLSSMRDRRKPDAPRIEDCCDRERPVRVSAGAAARLALCTVAFWWMSGMVMAAEPRDVLVLYSNGRLVPGNVEVEAGLQESIRSSSERPVQVFSEFLDLPAFGGADYEATMARYLREKYASHPPSVVVVAARDALDFSLRHRAELFPGVPIVHTAVFASFPEPLGALPADVVGVPVEYDILGTIEQALKWHPGVRQVVFVSGSTPRDLQWEQLFRRTAKHLASPVEVVFMAQLPSAEVAARLHALDRHAVVFTSGFYRSGDGRWFTPRQSVEFMAQASGAPIYGSLSSFLGTGAVGGRVASFAAMGRQAGQIVNAVLAGAPPASIPMPQVMANVLDVDARQTQRWNIDEADIPTSAVVEFKEPTFWESHRTASLVISTVILLQFGLIATLMLEHRRRRNAEMALVQRGGELAHASRLAVAGELTASIAHEINQPLAAILANTEAAEMLLATGRSRHEDLASILGDIRRDDLRASNVISRLRTLLARQASAREEFELNDAIEDGCQMLAAEARRREIALVLRRSPGPMHITGDPIQIQQVLINLALNAMDAIGDLPDGRRRIVVSVRENADRVHLEVSDRGRGIATEHLSRLFDSFFSTKQRGMGLGLSITRSIVEAHGGRIWAQSTPGAFTVFHVELPLFVQQSIRMEALAWT